VKCNVLSVDLLKCCGASSLSPGSSKAVQQQLAPQRRLHLHGGTHAMNKTSHFPSFQAPASSFSNSTTFCSSFSFPMPSFSASVTFRPYSPTLVNCEDASSSFSIWLPVWPVAPMTSAERPHLTLNAHVNVQLRWYSPLMTMRSCQLGQSAAGT
jgi:hypothetical protein